MIEPGYFSGCIAVRDSLLSKPTFEEKIEYLLTVIDPKRLQGACDPLLLFLERATLEEKAVLYQALYIDQGSLFPSSSQYRSSSVQGEEARDTYQKVVECISGLLQVDRFYSSLGGLIGYHVEVMRQLQKNVKNEHVVNEDAIRTYLPPPFFDMREDSPDQWKYIYQGVMSLPHAAEFYAVGGAGDRLNLMDPFTQEPKPAACLSILGKTLLQWLFDDIEAREYWYYRVTGHAVTIPVVLMTSLEKNNDLEIEKLCDQNRWFCRPLGSMFRVVQPLVPLVDSEGHWVACEPFKLAMKPGGHGVIWKIAKDYGVYEWLKDRGVSSILVRQINNPLSGMDSALLALYGQGVSEKRFFGFASCPMRRGFHEGLIALEKAVHARLQTPEKVFLSNIEYVAFEALKKSDPELFSGGFPANVNLLYADLEAVCNAVDTHPFPGLIVNMKNDVEIQQGDGRKITKRTARLESTMQNISESFSLSYAKTMDYERLKADLPAFIQMHQRNKILSVAKRTFDLRSGIVYETPVSFLYDWVCSTRLLLEDACGAVIPQQRASFEEFLKKGPEFLFCFHPSLGPLWAVIAQKIRKLSLHEGAYINLSIAEIAVESLSIRGALSIIGNYNTFGDSSSSGGAGGPTRSDRLSRAYIRNVVIENLGVDLSPQGEDSLAGLAEGIYEVKETCSIILEGFSEVWMENVTLRGSFSLTVPDGMKATILQNADGSLSINWEQLSSRPSWIYNITWREGERPVLALEVAETMKAAIPSSDIS